MGDLDDLGKVLDDMAVVSPRSAGLGVAGDITPRGYDFASAQVRERLKKHPHPRTVAWAIGNHEFYVPKYRDPDTLSQETWPNGTTEDSLFPLPSSAASTGSPNGAVCMTSSRGEQSVEGPSTRSSGGGAPP